MNFIKIFILILIINYGEGKIEELNGTSFLIKHEQVIRNLKGYYKVYFLKDYDIIEAQRLIMMKYKRIKKRCDKFMTNVYCIEILINLEDIVDNFMNKLTKWQVKNNLTLDFIEKDDEKFGTEFSGLTLNEEVKNLESSIISLNEKVFGQNYDLNLINQDLIQREKVMLEMGLLLQRVPSSIILLRSKYELNENSKLDIVSLIPYYEDISYKLYTFISPIYGYGFEIDAPFEFFASQDGMNLFTTKEKPGIYKYNELSYSEKYFYVNVSKKQKNQCVIDILNKGDATQCNVTFTRRNIKEFHIFSITDRKLFFRNPEQNLITAKCGHYSEVTNFKNGIIELNYPGDNEKCYIYSNNTLLGTLEVPKLYNPSEDEITWESIKVWPELTLAQMIDNQDTLINIAIALKFLFIIFFVRFHFTVIPENFFNSD
ncbi:hypothetical protein PVAND_000625 [Polypedilum vanderplanki]|uniref:Uncharacterized protein n=1 Tax=Polypedilum vanderplanki TaxID=319348 RepID=A0A9J6BL53_POLVA|nr:hypothetical protein PVAND_000625 [Polypedilum vanderplanki]